MAAGNSASIAPATGPAQRQSIMYTIMLPGDVASSGNLELSTDKNEFRGSAGYVKNVVIGNVKASSTNCAELEISKYGPAAVQPNGTVDYRIYVTNNGPSAVDYTVTDQDTSNNSSSVTTSVDETMEGSLIDSSAAVGAFGAVSLAFGVTGWRRRRASRVDV
ncbi:hypothetical protein [Streptomyces sioyaensis]|uniref:hypothetical protein n=1 Tax=Streptomyces sioyaensis TaxID=67364 RepID=UPI0037AE8D4B